MASHPLITTHLSALSRRLPAAAVDELADGLIETYHHYLGRGLDPTIAARTAITEFGSIDQIVTAFVRQAPGRRIAQGLLATGPAVGVCWATALIVGQVWTWKIPIAHGLGFGLGLLAAIVVLCLAAGSRRNYRQTRLAAVGGLGLTALDVAMLCAAFFVAPTLVWPMAIAIPASLARISLTARVLPRIFAS